MDIATILKSLCPGAEWSIDGSEIKWEEDLLDSNNLIPVNLIWHSPEISIPTKLQIDTRNAELQAISDSLEYQRLRVKEYPPLENLADALFWQANGNNSKMTAYLEQVAAVKDRYPKGTI